MLAPGRRTMLQGWKEIADYVSRDERTVKRWEKQRRLPVRRMPGTGRTNVYVLVSELDDWLSHSPLPAAAEVPVIPASAPQTRSWPLPMALAVFLFVAAATVFVMHAHRVRASASTAATPYISNVPGVDDLYLRGVYFYEQHTPISLAQSRQYLQQAVAKDPADAPAWSTLASATLMLEQFEAVPEFQGFDEAGTAARRAIALDPSLADAHATLGFVDFFFSRDSVTADREFHTALTLDPNSANAHQRYGLMLLDLRRFPQALAEFDLALHLQPTSTSIVAGRALALGLNGHRDEAVGILQSLAAQQSQNPIVYRDLSLLAQMQPHIVPLYLNSMERIQQIEHHSEPWPDMAFRAYRSGGEPAMWQAILASEPITSDTKAEALAQLGQFSAALDILEADARRPQAATSGFALDPLLFDPLHHDPRYRALLARIGLPPMS